MDHDELRDLSFKREEQVEWWKNNKDQLTHEEKDEIFRWAIEEPDNKFTYFELVTEITLDNINEPDLFVEDLRRLAPYVDGDLAWSELYKSFRDRWANQTNLANETYQVLINEDDEWLLWVAGVALGQQSEKVVRDESLRLLSSDDSDRVRAGIQAAMEQYQEQEVPSKHIKAFQNTSERDNFQLKKEILRANTVLFKENYELWELTYNIGINTPQTLPYIIKRFASEIEKEHLRQFLDLLKEGIQSNSSVDIASASYFMHSRFSGQTDDLADFVIWLSDHDLYEAGRLAKEVTKKNQEFRAILENRRNEFSSGFFANSVLSESEEYADPDISELTRLLNAAFEESNPQKKGELLEDATDHFVSLVDSFEHARNVRSTEEEIDVLIHNRFSNHIQQWNTPILIECRNRKEKIQAKDIRNLEGNMQNRGTDTAFFVARSEFTEGSVEQVKLCRAYGRENMIGMVTMDDLFNLTESDEITSLLMDKYDGINEL